MSVSVRVVLQLWLGVQLLGALCAGGQHDFVWLQNLQQMTLSLVSAAVPRKQARRALRCNIRHIDDRLNALLCSICMSLTQQKLRLKSMRKAFFAAVV